MKTKQIVGKLVGENYKSELPDEGSDRQPMLAPGEDPFAGDDFKFETNVPVTIGPKEAEFILAWMSKTGANESELARAVMGRLRRGQRSPVAKPEDKYSQSSGFSSPKKSFSSHTQYPGHPSRRY